MRSLWGVMKSLLVLTVGTGVLVKAATYKLAKDYSGSTFFDEWTFYGHFDNLTNGDVTFVSAAQAASQKLAFVDPVTNHAIIKVDNTSVVPFNEKRNAVRITSNDQFGVGSVWVADFFHVPYGCSVWPAYWSQASTWPKGGEIDTFEGVNLMTLNQMSLHTLPGCSLANPVQTSPLINSTNCDSQANHNQGCIVTDPSPASYGEAFAAAGGGVFVTEYAESGISIWFFSRPDVPDALTEGSGSLDTSALGKPTANWPTGGCNMDQFFSAQSLIIDITLCGDFARPPNIFLQTCTGQCYPDYVVGNGSIYATAYFDIASVRVFNTAGSSVSPTNSTSTSNNSASSKFPLTVISKGWCGSIALLMLVALGASTL